MRAELPLLNTSPSSQRYPGLVDELAVVAGLVPVKVDRPERSLTFQRSQAPGFSWPPLRGGQRQDYWGID